MSNLSLELIPFESHNHDLELHVQVARDQDKLTLKYSVLGKDAHKVDFDVHNQEKLWENTCFEFFVKDDRLGKNYYEINLASNLQNHGHYFSDYRSSGLGNELEKIDLQPSHIYFEKNELHFTLPLSNFKKLDTDHGIFLAISCVLKLNDETLYYALKHPYDKPDFHSPDGFCIELN